MGRRVQRPPVTEAEYLAGLAEGRNLYQEDLDRIERRDRLVHRATIGVVVFAMVVMWIIVAMLGLK
jgi:type IV secretory pathway component VirB8